MQVLLEDLIKVDGVDNFVVDTHNKLPPGNSVHHPLRTGIIETDELI